MSKDNKEKFNWSRIIRGILSIFTFLAGAVLALYAGSLLFKEINSEEFALILTIIGLGITTMVFSWERFEGISSEKDMEEIIRLLSNIENHLNN